MLIMFELFNEIVEMANVLVPHAWSVPLSLSIDSKSLEQSVEKSFLYGEAMQIYYLLQWT